MSTDIPDAAFTVDLTDYQFRLLAVLCRLTAHGEALKASATELGVMTGGTHRVTVQRALTALEAASLVQIDRTRKAGGYQDSSRITVLGRSQSSASATLGTVIHSQSSATTTQSASQSSASATATGDYLATTTTSHSHSHESDSHCRNTSYSYKGLRPREGDTKEILVMGRYDYDDDLPGFGLLDEPQRQDKTKTKIPRNRVSTRHQRPREEWTAFDVAAEFADSLYEKYPKYFGLMHLTSNGKALAANRKRVGTTPLLELEMVRIFLSDERNLRNLDERLPKLFSHWLANWGDLLPRARKSLGVSSPRNVETGSSRATVAPAATTSNKLVASDGTEWDNTITGREWLRRYEERLKRA